MEVVKVGLFGLTSDLRGKAFSLSPLSMMLYVDFLYIPFISVEVIHIVCWVLYQVEFCQMRFLTRYIWSDGVLLSFF